MSSGGLAVKDDKLDKLRMFNNWESTISSTNNPPLFSNVASIHPICNTFGMKAYTFLVFSLYFPYFKIAYVFPAVINFKSFSRCCFNRSDSRVTDGTVVVIPILWCSGLKQYYCSFKWVTMSCFTCYMDLNIQVFLWLYQSKASCNPTLHQPLGITQLLAMHR